MTASEPAATTPRGRQETVTALIEACERLCSSTPPSLISIRDVASEAGVTPGLVHHYFDSKDALIAATLRSIASDAVATPSDVSGAVPEPVEMVRTVWRRFEERPAFAYIIAWWLLEGRNVTEAMGDHPFIRRLSTAFSEAGDPDGPTHAAVIATMIIAGTVFGPGFNRALDRPTDDSVMRRALERAVVTLTKEGQSS